jgi:NAD(P)-dependent dehydrogenase (short-subunit alcohol dehydrogenase family)
MSIIDYSRSNRQYITAAALRTAAPNASRHRCDRLDARMSPLKRRDLADAVVSVREPRRLPVVLSPEEVARLLASGLAGYCATKGGVRLFAKAVAMECAAADDGIRVNTVHPGVIDTPIWTKIPASAGSKRTN